MSIALIFLFLRRRRKPSLKIAAALLLAVSMSMVSHARAQDSGLADQAYAMAIDAYQRSQWSQSVTALDDFVDRYPNHEKNDEARFFLAETNVQLGNHSVAVSAFQKFVERNPDHRLTPRAIFRLGESAYQLNKKKTALKSLELFVKKYPKHQLVEYALVYVGELRLDFDEPALARQAFLTALRLYPESTRSDQCRYGLAQSLRRLGKGDLANRYYRYLVDKKNSAYEGLAKLQLGVAACESGELNEARRLLSSARATFGNSIEKQIEADYWLGRVAIEMGEFERASQIFTGLTMLPSDPNIGARICHDAALAAWRTDQNDLAAEWLSKLRSTWPNSKVAAQALAMEITLLREESMDVVALEFCQRFADRFPDDPLRFSVAETAARIRFDQKKYAVAASDFEQLLEQHAAKEDTAADKESRLQRANWLYLKGLCHIELKEFETALKDLRLAQANDLSPAARPQISLAIASAMFGQHLYADAAKEFESFLDHVDSANSKNRNSAQSRLVVCYAHLDRWEEATQLAEALFAKSKSTGLKASRFLAQHASSKQRYDLAIAHYQRLAAPDNDAPFRNDGLKGLSRLMMQTQSDEANEVFRRLVEEYPDSGFSSQAAISRARFLEEQGDEIGARSVYQSIVDRFPISELAQISRLRLAWFYQQDESRESLQLAQSLIDNFLDTANVTLATEHSKSLALVPEALYQLAWINHDLGNEQQSQDNFAELVAMYPKSKYWADSAYRVAKDLVDSGEYEHATAMISRVLGRESIGADIKIQALYLQSQIAAKGDRWDRIPELMDEVIEQANDQKVITAAKYWLAESRYRIGEFEQAARIFDEIQLNSESLEADLEPWMLLRLAQCHGKAQRWTNAAMIARDCKDRFPKFDHAHEFDFLLGRAAEYDGMFVDARTHFQSVIESSTGSKMETAAIAQWRIGETFFHQEQYKDAIGAYFKAASNYTFAKWSSAALIQAGKCQEHLGNWSHAEKLYTQLVEQYPESEFYNDASQRLIRVSELTGQSTDTRTR